MVGAGDRGGAGFIKSHYNIFITRAVMKQQTARDENRRIKGGGGRGVVGHRRCTGRRGAVTIHPLDFPGKSRLSRRVAGAIESMRSKEKKTSPQA